MVSERSDWCISVNAAGRPIPVFYEKQLEKLLTEDFIARSGGEGSDAWWELPVEELLPEQYRNNGRSYRKGTDTMDVWFDSAVLGSCAARRIATQRICTWKDQTSIGLVPI